MYQINNVLHVIRPVGHAQIRLIVPRVILANFFIIGCAILTVPLLLFYIINTMEHVLNASHNAQPV